MSSTNSDGKEHSDVAPILRAVFPEFTEDELQRAHVEFARFLGLLYDDYREERKHDQERRALDGERPCDSLNNI